MTEPKSRGEYEVLFQEAESRPIDVNLALELDAAIDSALGSFEREHGDLVRASCNVPIETTEIRGVVLASFLSHILARVESQIGRADTETLVTVVLDKFEVVRSDFVSSEAVQ